MKLGVLTSLYGSIPLEEAIPKFAKLGIESLELGAGGYPGKSHCNPDVILGNREEKRRLNTLLEGYGMDISALSAHGNPVHPDRQRAEGYHRDFEKAVLLCEELEVDTLVLFSGCPGGSPEDKTPNWATCAWPEDYLGILNYQWNEVLIPYWTRQAEFARSHGVTKLAFEMHPGFCVYNPETLLKLRRAVGDTVGANLDPSHLIWQGINLPSAISALRGAIYHFHAKDTQINPQNTAVNGVLDTKDFALGASVRSWIARTVGYGNGFDYWRDMISSLKESGYDKVLSIEHEDSLMTADEGLEASCKFLRKCIECL